MTNLRQPRSGRGLVSSNVSPMTDIVHIIIPIVNDGIIINTILRGNNHIVLNITYITT